MSEYAISLQVEFKFPAEVIKQNPHKSSVCRLSHLTDGSMVSCSLVCVCMYVYVCMYVCVCVYNYVCTIY